MTYFKTDEAKRLILEEISTAVDHPTFDSQVRELSFLPDWTLGS
jgi:hypothetical protein